MKHIIRGKKSTEALGFSRNSRNHTCSTLTLGNITLNKHKQEYRQRKTGEEVASGKITSYYVTASKVRTEGQLTGTVTKLGHDGVKLQSCVAVALLSLANNIPMYFSRVSVYVRSRISSLPVFSPFSRLLFRLWPIVVKNIIRFSSFLHVREDFVYMVMLEWIRNISAPYLHSALFSFLNLYLRTFQKKSAIFNRRRLFRITYHYQSVLCVNEIALTVTCNSGSSGCRKAGSFLCAVHQPQVFVAYDSFSFFPSIKLP